MECPDREREEDRDVLARRGHDLISPRDCELDESLRETCLPRPTWWSGPGTRIARASRRESGQRTRDSCAVLGAHRHVGVVSSETVLVLPAVFTRALAERRPVVLCAPREGHDPVVGPIQCPSRKTQRRRREHDLEVDAPTAGKTRNNASHARAASAGSMANVLLSTSMVSPTTRTNSTCRGSSRTHAASGGRGRGRRTTPACRAGCYRGTAVRPAPRAPSRYRRRREGRADAGCSPHSPVDVDGRGRGATSAGPYYPELPFLLQRTLRHRCRGLGPRCAESEIGSFSGGGSRVRMPPLIHGVRRPARCQWLASRAF